MRIFMIFVIYVCLFVAMPCEAAPEPGKKKAFGAGLLGGAIVGGLVGKAFGQHHSHSSHSQQQSNTQQVATDARITIERGPVEANGCYRQTVKEPDHHNARKYVETVQMICPPAVAAPVAPVAHIVPAASYAPVAAASSSSATNITHYVAPAQVVAAQSPPQSPQVFVLSQRVYKTKKSAAPALLGSTMLAALCLLIAIKLF